MSEKIELTEKEIEIKLAIAQCAEDYIHQWIAMQERHAREREDLLTSLIHTTNKSYTKCLPN